ncbi:MAG: replicative DNA helicase, partial [Bacteroidales bacterium]|nr:replicative DNA helicase [Bacteroidales bacterium]
MEKTYQDTQRVRTRTKPGDIAIDTGKIPPQAVDIEEAVLGALMIDANALNDVIDILKPIVFYKESHRRIFAAIQELFGKNEPVDLLTVTNQLKLKGDLDLAGGPFYLTQLTSRIASAANIEFHARIILQKFLQRELIRLSNDVIKDAYEDRSDVFELLDKAESNLFEISENNFRRGYENMQSLIKKAISQIEEARKQDGNISGIPSGFTALDHVTAGWQKSDLIIIAARPGMGKTALVLSMARNIVIDHATPVAVFSLEMAAIQLVTRLIASESGLPAEKLKKGQLEEHEWTQLNTRITNLVDAKLFIDDTPALSVFELRAKCRRLKAQHDIQLIIVDYLQLMTASEERGMQKGNREQEISTISRALKSLSKELNVPVICLSQLNRSVETRGGDKRPLLSDLRESGAIEQDADMVIFIYRPEYYKIDEDSHGNSTANMAELIIAKHRNGALADIKLTFHKELAKFANPD